MPLEITCDFLSCLCLEGDENGQEQDGHAEKRSAEEEEVSDTGRVMAVGRSSGTCCADKVCVDAAAERLRLASGLAASAAGG